MGSEASYMRLIGTILRYEDKTPLIRVPTDKQVAREFAQSSQGGAGLGFDRRGLPSLP